MWTTLRAYWVVCSALLLMMEEKKAQYSSSRPVYSSA